MGAKPADARPSDSEAPCLDWGALPGGDLVCKGLADLEHGRYTEEALLLLVAGPALRVVGIAVPDPPDVPRPREHLLYAQIESRLGRGAHSRYNSLLRRINSFVKTYATVNRS